MASAEPALTIYNQNFAVVRDTVPLDLQAGANTVRFAGATAQVEPDSVILRDPAGRHSLQILEQNYRNDPVSEPLLLSLFEGKTIDFEKLRMKDNTETRELIPGKIVRSGYIPGGEAQQPIIEVNSKLQFSLPGTPLFPDLGDDTVLKPAFNWLLQSDKPGKFDAEVGYVTEGFEWNASYNLVSEEKGDNADLVAWITMKNESGKTFEDAKIQLMAGDVNKIQDHGQQWLCKKKNAHGHDRKCHGRGPRCHRKSLRRISSLLHRAAHNLAQPGNQAGGICPRREDVRAHDLRL